MRFVAALACLLLAGFVQGQTTQPATQPVVNGPKIARELREKIAQLETQLASSEKKIEDLQKQLDAVTRERDAMIAEKNATPEGKAELDRKRSVEAAILKHEVVRGMTLAECEKSTGTKGAKTDSLEDGSDVYRFVVSGEPIRTARNNRPVTVETHIEWTVWIRKGTVTNVSVRQYSR